MNLFDLRTEVIHPLSVHFPIVLLLIASFLSWLSLLRPRRDGLKIALFWSLLLGSASAWLAVYTGDLADGRVSRSLCDPTILKQHENFALALSYTYTVMLVIAGAKQLLAFRKPRLLVILLAVLGLAGAAMVVYVGHLGASLVYEQAAGVVVPPDDCAGF